jgi:selenide,water dikinase
VITPIVDDARAFGRIAAANALSDVYAMGGDVQVALSFVGLPASLGLETFHDVLYGAAEKATEAGCAIVGGHTIKDSEPKCGLAVIGSVDPDTAWSHTHAKAGQQLVLTKPIGTGVLGQALRAAEADAAWIQAATTSMERLNAEARDRGREHDVTAATDVTGFGLLGHLKHMVEASGLSAVLDTSAVPLLDGALEAAAAGHVPGGSKRNLRYVEAQLEGAGDVDEALLTLLADAQTSGGLLLATSAGDALAASLDGARVIGELQPATDGNVGRLRLV